MDNPPVLLLDVCLPRMDPYHIVATLLLRLTPAACHTLLATDFTTPDETPTVLKPRHQWPSPTPPPTRVLLDAGCLPSPLPVLPPGATIGRTLLYVRRLPGSIDRHLFWSGSPHSIDLPWLNRGVSEDRSTRSEQLPATLVFEALLGGLPADDMPAVIEQYAKRLALPLLSALETLAAASAGQGNPLHPLSPPPDALLPLLQVPDRHVRERAQLLLARFSRPAPDLVPGPVPGPSSIARAAPGRPR